VVAYFLEARGLLAAVEPGWLAASGLGYILWGMAAAVVAAVIAALVAPARAGSP